MSETINSCAQAFSSSSSTGRVRHIQNGTQHAPTLTSGSLCIWAAISSRLGAGSGICDRWATCCTVMSAGRFVSSSARFMALCAAVAWRTS